MDKMMSDIQDRVRGEMFELTEEQIAVASDPKSLKIIKNALGLAAEAGEVADLAKKVFFLPQRAKNITRETWIDELGDVMWHFMALLNTLDITVEEVAEYNERKLSERYPNHSAE